MDFESETLIVREVAGTLKQRMRGATDEVMDTLVAHSLRADGFDASEDGTGRGTPLVPVDITNLTIGDSDLSGTLEAGQDRGNRGQGVIAFSAKDNGADAGELAPTLRSMGHDQSHPNGGGQIAVAVNFRRRECGTQAELGGEVATSLRGAGGTASKAHALTKMAVRRLTPRECERLQGFADEYTQITYRGKPAADGPRYKALGNSMAVPVIRWILTRIVEVRSQQGGQVDAVSAPKGVNG